VSVQAQDPRRPLEGAQHHADAAVLAQVRDRLSAASDQIEVGDRVRIEHLQALDRALRREVDVAAGLRRGGDEEHLLAADPPRQLVVDLSEHLAHVVQPSGLKADARPERTD
jgi:hypothetical protein